MKRWARICWHGSRGLERLPSRVCKGGPSCLISLQLQCLKHSILEIIYKPDISKLTWGIFQNVVFAVSFAILNFFDFCPNGYLLCIKVIYMFVCTRLVSFYEDISASHILSTSASDSLSVGSIMRVLDTANNILNSILLPLNFSVYLGTT